MWFRLAQNGFNHVSWIGATKRNLKARSHLKARGQPISVPLIASLLPPAQPVSTVTRARAASYEIRHRQSVRRRGCNPPRDVRTLAVSSAQQRLVHSANEARHAFTAAAHPICLQALSSGSPSRRLTNIMLGKLSDAETIPAFVRPIRPVLTTPSQPFINLSFSDRLAVCAAHNLASLASPR
jgi:hypothetical protein